MAECTVSVVADADGLAFSRRREKDGGDDPAALASREGRVYSVSEMSSRSSLVEDSMLTTLDPPRSATTIFPGAATADDEQ